MTEFETVNEAAQNGDWIVQNNPNNPKERYVVKQAKFEKLYDVENPIEYANGTLYQANETVVRKCIVVTKEVAEYFRDIGLTPSATQEQMLSVCKGLKQHSCQKNATVIAWQWTEKDGNVETHVMKSNNEHVLNFVAPWGAEMPLKVGDTIIVMEDECYRIAQAEFARTYEILTDLG